MSTETQQLHTSGPWLVDTSIKGCIDINQKGGTSVAYIEPMFRMGNEQENLANARLIAAAPELLEALEEIQGQLARYGDWDDGCFYLNGRATPELEHGMRLATAAITKAKHPKEAAGDGH